MQYVRDYYIVPVKRGGRVVVFGGREGVITRATHYVYVRVEGGRARPYHPLDLIYLPEEAPND